MSLVTFDELIRTVPLSVEEAAALTLGAGEALDRRRSSEPAPALPSDTELTLDRNGTVAIESMDRCTLPDEVKQLGALLRRLLRLDDGAEGSRRRVPGALVVLIARAVGHIDVPPPTRAAFRAALLRFVGDDPQAVRTAVFKRAAAERTSAPDGAREALVAARLLSNVAASATTPPSSAPRALPATAPETFTPAAPHRANVSPVRTGAQAVAYRRRGARQWLAGGTEAALAISGAVVATLVLVTLVEQGRLRPATPGPSTRPRVAASAVRGTTGEAAPRVAPAASTRVVASRNSDAPAEILDAALVGRDAFSPSYSAGGRTIYFHAGRQRAALMRAAIDSEGRVTDVATVLDDGASNYHVTASPDGTQIAFDSDRDGVRGVYIARVDGTRARRVSGPGYAAVPSWSPDGRRLAFIKAESGRRNVWNVWLADLPGDALHRVTSHTSGQAWGASWFPDGRRIAYSRERQLVIADLSSGTATAIGSPVSGHLVRTPAVSPDGARVIFQVHGDGAWMLDVVRQRVRRVLSDRSAEEFVWSPDGHRIAYHALRNGSWGVWTMASGA
jgi:hypothetical protein